VSSLDPAGRLRARRSPGRPVGRAAEHHRQCLQHRVGLVSPVAGDHHPDHPAMPVLHRGRPGRRWPHPLVRLLTDSADQPQPLLESACGRPSAAGHHAV